MPKAAFLGAQIARKSLTALPRPSSWIQGALLPRLLLLRGGKGRGRQGREGPRKIVHPEKFLRIGPERFSAKFDRGHPRWGRLK